MKSHFRYPVFSFAPVILSIGLSLAAVAILYSPAPGAQIRRPHRPPSARGVPAAPVEVVMPFRVGEKLDYRIAWSGFNNAASLELSIPERREIYGWNTWHFSAAFHTVRSVRALFQIDDQFDSYTDAATLECRQFEMYTSELGKTETKILHLIAKGQPLRGPGPFVIVLPGTRDPLGTLFTLRAADWQRTPELHIPAYDGETLYQVVARLEATSDEVQVDAGSFNASRVSIEVLPTANDETGLHFTVWYANDAAHTPVSMFANLPFGNLRVELTTANSGQSAAQ